MSHANIKSAFVALFLLCSVVVTCVVVASTVNSGSGGYLGIDFCVGSVFGFAILAGSWLVLGPGRLPLRFSLALCWIFVIPLSLVSLISNDDVGVFFLSSGLIAVLAFIVAMVSRFYFGCVVTRLSTESDPEQLLQPIQFGIKQLLILTTLSAILLTVGRVILQKLPNAMSGKGELPLFVFLGVAVVLSCMPVMFSILLKRKIIVALLVTLAFGVAITYFQTPLLQRVSKRPRPDLIDVTLINSFALLQIFVFVGALRVGGYGFESSKLNRTSSKIT